MSLFASDSRLRRRPGPVGHQAKIAAALRALRMEGKLPDYLRLGETHVRVCRWLQEQGLHDSELPSAKAVSRFIAAEVEAEAREDANAIRPNRPERPMTSGDRCE